MRKAKKIKIKDKIGKKNCVASLLKSWDKKNVEEKGGTFTKKAQDGEYGEEEIKK